MNKVIVIKNSCIRPSSLFYRHNIFWRSQFMMLQITFLEDRSFMMLFKLFSDDIIKSCTFLEKLYNLYNFLHIVYFLIGCIAHLFIYIYTHCPREDKDTFLKSSHILSSQIVNLIAVQWTVSTDSSIGDLATHSLSHCVTHSLTDLQHLRH